MKTVEIMLSFVLPSSIITNVSLFITWFIANIQYQINYIWGDDIFINLVYA